MDGSRFDTWTRRRFGLTTSGAAAGSLLGLLGLHDTDAKKNNNNKNKRKKRKKKKKCRKLQETCDNTSKNQKCCNKDLLCAQVSHLGSGLHCCKQLSQPCSEDADCCGTDRCGGDDRCQTQD